MPFFPYTKSWHAHETKTATKIKAGVSGLAAVCPSIRKETLEQLKADPNILATSEKFLKQILRHYSVDGDAPIVKQLLGCRVRLYFRVGRMLSAWPSSSFSIKKQLAVIESKYALEMREARARIAVVDPLYPKPVMTQTIEDDPERAKKKAKKVDTDIVLSATGAESSADGPEGSATSSAVVLPHAITPDMGVVMAFRPSSSSNDELWTRIASQCFIHAHLLHDPSVDKVQAAVVEACEPVVWQVRPRKQIAARDLVLVPWVLDKLVPDEENAKKKKRPTSFHPALMMKTTLVASATNCEDEYFFTVRSPLLSGKIGEYAPAPFWCVLKVKNEKEANMTLTTLTVTMTSPTLAIDGTNQPKKAKKASNLQLVVPVLTNTREVREGEVLTMYDGAKDEEDEGAGDDGDEGGQDTT